MNAEDFAEVFKNKSISLGSKPFSPCSPGSPLSPGVPGGPGGPGLHVSSSGIR